MRWKLKLGTDRFVSVDLHEINGSEYRFSVDGKEVVLHNPQNFPFSLQTDEVNLSFEAKSSRQWRATQGASVWTLEPQIFGEASQHSLSILRSQMPGRIVDVCVSEGQGFEKGDKLLVMEAMKMENEIRAETSSKVKKLHIKKGQSVESDQILIEFDL